MSLTTPSFMTTYQKQTVTAFINCVPNVDSRVAAALLSTTGWDLDTAINIYYDCNGDIDSIMVEIVRRNAKQHFCLTNHCQNMYSPPAYNFIGSLEDAKKTALQQNKSILINIQDIKHPALNRDIWRDTELALLIEEQCIFYQRISISDDAKNIINAYNVSEIPCIFIIDPNGTTKYRWIVPDPVNGMKQLKKKLLHFFSKYKQQQQHFDKKIMKNPFVIIIGIADYEHPDYSSLPAVKQDINNMKLLWINKCKYKYVSWSNCCIQRSELQKFIKNREAQIQLNGEEWNIDGLIFIYSGHGGNTNKLDMVCSDGQKLYLSDIQDIFSTTCCLQGKPKIFYMDCCRGEREIKNNEIKQISKGSKNCNPRYINILSDFYVHYATSDNYEALCVNGNNFGSHLINAIYTYYGDEFDKNQAVALNACCVKINQMINKSSNGRQTAEVSNKLLCEVSITPNNS